MNWIKKHKSELLILLGILILAAFLRLYRINEYMTFLGDEGRDAIVIKKILTEFDLPLLGPPTSIGNMYLGPLYYYMMSVAMTFSWLNPVAAAVMVALIGTATVLLIYYLAREWFGRGAAIIASLLYALSPVNIIYSRSSWNPNPAPFFTLLAVLGFYLANKKRDYRWLILTGAAVAFASQMHYLALILIPIFIILWCYEYFNNRLQKNSGKYFVWGTLGGILIFLFLMSPLVIFDLRHNFLNYRALTTFFGQRETTVNLNILNTLGRIVPIYHTTLVERYITGKNLYLNMLVSLLVLSPVVWWIYQKVKKRQASYPIMVLGVWLIVGVLGLSLYKQTIYDHYLGFLNPVPFLLLGGVFYLIRKIFTGLREKILIGGFLVLAATLCIVSLQATPLKAHPNNQLKRTQEIAKYVISKSANRPYNFALLAEHNYDSAYQFYLDIYGHPPKQLPFDITEQLFVVCEDKVCQPINHPKYEIAAFGWAKVDEVSDMEGVKVFKLVKNPDGKR